MAMKQKVIVLIRRWQFYQNSLFQTQYKWQHSLMASEETSIYADLKYVNDSSKQVRKIYKTTLTLLFLAKL